MKFELKTTFDWAKIYIDRILHISFKHNDLTGIQSWNDTGRYYIEYTFKDNTSILSEYDKITKWKAILNLLNKNL